MQKELQESMLKAFSSYVLLIICLQLEDVYLTFAAQRVEVEREPTPAFAIYSVIVYDHYLLGLVFVRHYGASEDRCQPQKGTLRRIDTIKSNTWEYLVK